MHQFIIYLEMLEEWSDLKKEKCNQEGLFKWTSMQSYYNIVGEIKANSSSSPKQEKKKKEKLILVAQKL